MEADGSPQSPFRQILPKCKLARDLKEAYDRCVMKPTVVVSSFTALQKLYCSYTQHMHVFAACVRLAWCEYILTAGLRSVSVYRTRSTGLAATISPQRLWNAALRL